MIKTFALGSATVACAEIAASGALKRREAERRAVEALVQHLLPGATLGHLPSGAPTVDREVCISVSHSRRMAVVAVAPSPIGIDAEEDRPEQLRRVASRFVSEAEEAFSPSLLWAWTAKEAAFKAVPGLVALSDVALLSTTEAEAGGRSLHLCSARVGDTLITLAEC